MPENRRSGDEAQPDELGTDRGQVGQTSTGQSGDPQGLSQDPEAANESVQELAESEQSLEAARVEGVEDAANHPERPAHTHLEYPNPEDVAPAKGGKEAA